MKTLLRLALLLVCLSVVGLVAHRVVFSLLEAPPASYVSDAPISQNLPIPEVVAKSIFIIDPDSQTVLYQRNADERLYPASTTKMMTALVANEQFSHDQKITVTVAYPEGQDAGFMPGEVIDVENLLYALLVNSANDSAEILAENWPEGRPGFVNAMNQKAINLGLKNTFFKNPTGLDEEGHYSSAADLARIAQELIRHPYLGKIVSTEAAVVNTTDRSIYHPVTNINELLGHVPGVVGIKTGFTDLAGQSLVTLVDRDHRRVLVVLLGSTDRFADTKSLIDWSYSNFTWD
ncbi:MAG: D-alanyl-D-alanine carboxypeptidase family protein [Patescibacteria group bacterium]